MFQLLVQDCLLLLLSHKMLILHFFEYLVKKKLVGLGGMAADSKMHLPFNCFHALCEIDSSEQSTFYERLSVYLQHKKQVHFCG